MRCILSIFLIFVSCSGVMSSLFAEDFVPNEVLSSIPAPSVPVEQKMSVSVGHLCEIQSWCIADSQNLLITIDDAHVLKVFDLETGMCLSTWKLVMSPYVRTDSEACKFFFSEDDSTVVLQHNFREGGTLSDSFGQQRKTEYLKARWDILRMGGPFTNCSVKPKNIETRRPAFFTGTSFTQLNYILSQRVLDESRHASEWKALSKKQKEAEVVRYLQKRPFPRLVETPLRNAFTKIVNSQLAATFTRNGKISFWNIQTGETQFEIRTDFSFAENPYPVYIQSELLNRAELPVCAENIRFCADGRQLIVFHFDSVSLYDVERQKLIYDAKVELHHGCEYRIRPDYITDASFRDSLLTVQTKYGGVEIHHLSTHEVQRFRTSDSPSRVLTPSGKWVELPPDEPRKYFWNPYDSETLYFLHSYDEETLDDSSEEYSVTLQKWNVRTKKCQTIRKVSAGSGLELSLDGRFLHFTDVDDGSDMKFDMATGTVSDSVLLGSERFWDFKTGDSFDVVNAYEIIIYDKNDREKQTTYRFTKDDFLIEKDHHVTGSPEGMKRYTKKPKK